MKTSDSHRSDTPAALASVHVHAFGDESGCIHCQNKHEFLIPHSLIESFSKGEVVVFAGAGISTENKEVMPYTLHEDICSELRIDKTKVAFPDAAEQFVATRDGRIKLAQKIIDRFKYVDFFFELRDEATQFHTELATLFGVTTVVTTNWDTYFEEYCGCQPFVLDADIAFWESANRRVLKIHGSVENLSTIVATRTDYVARQADLHKGLIGSWLKALLSTKTIVFFGYSLRDDDFIEIMTFVKQSLGAFTRQHYVVTLDDDPASVERYKSYGLVPICTDASYFIENVKDHIVESTCANPDSIYGHAYRILEKVRREHVKLYDRLDMQKYPEILYCGCYQDGLMHNLGRIVDTRKDGTYSDLHKVQLKLDAYRQRRIQKLRDKKFEDVAYIDGYMAGMLLALFHRDNPKYSPPIFYLYTREPSGFDTFDGFFKYLKFARRRREHHLGALAKAKKILADLEKLGTGLIYHHKCQLL